MISALCLQNFRFSASCSNSILGTRQILMHEKTCVIPISFSYLSNQLPKMSHINLMVNVMPKYRCTFTFTILFHLLLFMGLQAHDFSAYSVLRAIKYNEASTRKASLHYCSKAVINRKHYMSNVVFTNILILLLITIIIATWTYSLLLCCGDIHPHPGHVSSASTLSIDSSMSNSSCSMTDNLTLLFTTMHKAYHLNLI